MILMSGNSHQASIYVLLFCQGLTGAGLCCYRVLGFHGATKVWRADVVVLRGRAAVLRHTSGRIVTERLPSTQAQRHGDDGLKLSP